MAYVQGEDRYQITMFPDSIDDYVAEDNQVPKLKRKAPTHGITGDESTFKYSW